MTVTLFNAPSRPVHSPTFILHGQCVGQGIGQFLNISCCNPTRCEINQGYFKAFLTLQPGMNDIILEAGSEYCHLQIQYQPLMENPPLHLCLLVAKDSPMTFDSPAYKKQQENGHDLGIAVRKLQTAGRMMQAFTQQEMLRNGFGNRVFRFDEEGGGGDIKIHILKSRKTLKELRDPNLAQQNSKGTNTGGLFSIALDELAAQVPACHPSRTEQQPAYAAVMFLDTHWDTNLKLILTHAALGGGTDRIKLAIFGSHGLWSWPKNVHEIGACLTDETRTDTKEVANDCNECSTAWECVNITMGAFMHEIGHLYGCPHQENGIMLRDYVRWNRTFQTREAYCMRTKRKSWSPVSSKDECHWHRLDLMRFLYHPAFALPTDLSDTGFKPNIVTDPKLRKTVPLKPVVFPINARTVEIEAKAGIYLITCHVGEWSRFTIEFLPRCVGGAGPQQKAYLNYDEIQSRIAPQYRNQKLKIEILANGGEQMHIDDFMGFLSKNNSLSLKDPNTGEQVNSFKSPIAGRADGKEQPMAFIKDYHITKVRIHSGLALDGVEFFGYHRSAEETQQAQAKSSGSMSSAFQKLKLSGSSQPQEMFISRIGNVTNHYHDFNLDADEYIKQFNVRSGAWVDALQVVTSKGRQSQMYGGNGGGLGELKAPDGMAIIALYGSLGRWLNGLGIVYA